MCLKFILKFLLKHYLRFFARLFLFIHRPVVVGVAGSTNKYFVKELIGNKLNKLGVSNRLGQKNFNTEIGLPLAILNLSSGYNSYRAWWPAVLGAFSAVFKKPPRVLVLELGVSFPGDMSYLMKVVKPHIVVITEITQRYKESFSDMDRLVKEYAILAKNAKKTVVLNIDNLRIESFAGLQIGATKNTIGKNKASDWIILDILRQNYGLSFNVFKNNNITHHELKRFGIHHVYAEVMAEAAKQAIMELCHITTESRAN